MFLARNFSHRVSDHNCLYAHRRHAHEQIYDLFFGLVQNGFERGGVSKCVIQGFGAVRLVIGLDRDSLSEIIFIHRAADLRNGLTLTEMLYRGIS